LNLKIYLKKFLSFSLGTWVRAIISFFATPIISYLIIPEEFGRASMFTLVYNIALIISIMGLDQSYVRYYYEINENERNKTFWTALIPSVINGILISLIFIIFEKQLSNLVYSREYKYIGIIFLIALITGIFQRFNQLSVRMQKKGIFFSTIQILNALGNIGGTIIYALLIKPDFYAIVTGQITGNIISLIYGFSIDKILRKFETIQLNLIKKYIKYGLPFVPTFLIQWFFTSIDRISLKQYTTFTEIGLYSAAFKIVSVMNLIQAGFTTFWTPVAYEKYENNENNKDFFRKANLAISFVMFVFGFLVLSLKDIIFLILAKSYRDAAYIAPFLILTPIMYTISETTVLGINFKKKTYWHMVLVSISAIINYIGNTFLVPILGAKGAAISTGLSYVVFFILRTLIAEKLYYIGFEISKILIGIVITIILAYIGTFYTNTMLTIVSGIISIIIILFIYKNEIKWILKNLKKGV
jgi:O-antigen/teichoic acid export membrane protein